MSSLFLFFLQKEKQCFSGAIKTFPSPVSGFFLLNP
jgi:hypothetical protein